MRIDFHMNFSGQCREAFEFYQSLLGGEIELLTYGASPARIVFHRRGRKK